MRGVRLVSLFFQLAGSQAAGLGGRGAGVCGWGHRSAAVPRHSHSPALVSSESGRLRCGCCLSLRSVRGARSPGTGPRPGGRRLITPRQPRLQRFPLPPPPPPPRGQTSPA